jgi:hypothetical protein
MGRLPAGFYVGQQTGSKQKGVQHLGAAGCSEPEPAPGGGWLLGRGCPVICPYDVANYYL